MPPTFEGMNLITIGESSAQFIITLVTNPLCGQCGKVFSEIERLININNNFKCQIIFIATNFPGDEAGEFVRKLASIPHVQQIEALRNWFKTEHKNVKKWSRINGVNNEDPRNSELLELQL